MRLRSAGAPNLKAALKKIIRDAVAGGLEGREEDDGAEVSVGEDVCLFFLPLVSMSSWCEY